MALIALFASLLITKAQDPQANEVREALNRMELAAERHSYFVHALDDLPASSAPKLLEQFHTIKHGWVIESAAKWFVDHGYLKALPTLIASFDMSLPFDGHRDEPPAAQAVSWFGWQAVPNLIQTCRHGSPTQVAVCSKILANFCIYKPEDPKVVRQMIALTTSPDSRLREVGLQGLWKATVTDHYAPNDAIHFVEVDRPDLFRFIVDAACSSDQKMALLARDHLYELVVDVEYHPPKGYVRGCSDPKLSDTELKYLMHSKKAEMRALAVVLENENGLDRLRFAALTDPDPLVFHAAIVSSRSYIREDWTPTLIKLAASPDPQLRRGAAMLLAYTYDPAAKSTLHKLATDSNPSVRLAAAFDW